MLHECQRPNNLKTVGVIEQKHYSGFKEETCVFSFVCCRQPS